MPLPTVAFMHPTLVPRPIHRDGWVYEEKVDGYRTVAYENGTTVRLVSRQGKDHTTRFPELASALSKLDTSPSLVLDGEVAVYDKQLISRFEWLRHQAPLELATPSWPSIACTRAGRICEPARSTCAATWSRTC